MKILKVSHNQGQFSNSKSSVNNTPNYNEQSFEGLPTKFQQKCMKCFNETSSQKRKNFYTTKILQHMGKDKNDKVAWFYREFYKHLAYTQGAYRLFEQKLFGMFAKKAPKVEKAKEALIPQTKIFVSPRGTRTYTSKALSYGR